MGFDPTICPLLLAERERESTETGLKQTARTLQVVETIEVFPRYGARTFTGDLSLLDEDLNQ